MKKTLTGNYQTDKETVLKELRYGESYDIKTRILNVGKTEAVLIYVEGFSDSIILERMISFIIELDEIGDGKINAAESFAERFITAPDVRTARGIEEIIFNILSGRTILLSSGFCCDCLVIDARKYPSRTTSEPENDRVMRGSRDGFVESLLYNVTLIRRRIRDPELSVQYNRAGTRSKTDVALIYMHGKADPEYVNKISENLKQIDTSSIVLGHQSITETLIKNKWYNPFPKIRATERPDSAAAALLEGSLIILCDNSPEALILPTSVFDFLQVTDDYYFPPLTGSYLRMLRHLTFLMTIFLIPIWFLLIKHPVLIPDPLKFVIPSNPGELPIFLQIILTELAIDGLKLASLNTPDMLSGSLSIVGGLLLGDFAVQIGWLSPDVILYMAFVGIANFTQTSYELGYAFKYIRLLTLTLTAAFDIWGFIAGVAIALILLAVNDTSASGRGYLYPVIPFNRRALGRLLLRMKKDD